MILLYTRQDWPDKSKILPATEVMIHMLWGASTSNLYPELTENSLQILLDLGFRQIEIFFNTESEIAPTYLRGLRDRLQAVGAKITSVHPYLSGTEPYLLFSQYERRFRDGLGLYERIFEAAAGLQAPYVIMHGDRREGVLPADESIARFESVYDLGRRYGVTLLQENVVRFRSSDNDYLRQMRRQLGEKAGFVFDFKQCRRCGYTAEEVLDAMGDRVRHIHLSDATAGKDCLPPGEGTAGLVQVLRGLRKNGFSGAVILELYRSNFEDPAVLWKSMRRMEALLAEE